MPLTPEEITSFADSLAKNEIPEVLKPAVTAGFSIYTPGTKATYEEAFKGTIITERDKELRGQFETSIEEIYGVKKNAGEKASDYLKRVAEAERGELTQLREAKKTNSLTNVEKERLAELERTVGTHKADTEKLEKDYNEKLIGFRVSAETGSAINKIKANLKAVYKEGDIFNDIQLAKLTQFQKAYKPEEIADGDGTKIIYRDVAKNTPALNEKGTYATAEELLSGIFAPYIEKAPKVEGGGSPPPNGTPAGGGKPGETINKDAYVMPADIKTRIALADDLKANGFKAGTPEFTELLNKYGATLPLR